MLSKKRFAIINRLRSENFTKAAPTCFPTLSEIADILHMPVVGGIIDDDNIHLSVNGGLPVVCSIEGYILENFKKILEQGKSNSIMYLQFVIFIGIPLYFIYMTIKSLILVYKKYKKESK